MAGLSSPAIRSLLSKNDRSDGALDGEELDGTEPELPTAGYGSLVRWTVIETDAWGWWAVVARYSAPAAIVSAISPARVSTKSAGMAPVSFVDAMARSISSANTSSRPSNSSGSAS